MWQSSNISTLLFEVIIADTRRHMRHSLCESQSRGSFADQKAVALACRHSDVANATQRCTCDGVFARRLPFS